MPRKKAGMGDYGRQRIRRNWEDIESGNLEPSGATKWLVGGEPTEENSRLKEAIAAENEAFNAAISAQDVTALVDLWPDKSNYYQGPSRSTRVVRHRFVLNQASGVIPTNLGTIFVQFTNLRQRKSDGTVYEGKFHNAVYAYFDVPYSVYQSFTQTHSKGQFINHTLNNYTYADLKKDDSVFTTDYKD